MHKYYDNMIEQIKYYHYNCRWDYKKLPQIHFFVNFFFFFQLITFKGRENFNLSEIFGGFELRCKSYQIFCFAYFLDCVKAEV